jgi:small subunit ribosomal protein S20
MPIIKSAKKALKVEARRKAENDDTRAKLKNAVKGLKVAVVNGEKNVVDLLNNAYKQVDLAAKKHVIHKNKASRVKSQLAKTVSPKK